MPAAFSIPILGRIDNFWIIVAIIIASTLWEWIKKKGRLEETDSSPGGSESPRRPTTTPPLAAPRPVAMGGWEEELRRLLGGEVPPAKPPRAPPPPIGPVILQNPPASPPPRPVMAAPPAARPDPARLGGPRIAAADQAVDVQLPSLRESVTAYHRAGHLHEEMAEQMKRIEQMTQRHTSKVPIVHRHTHSIEAAQTISLIRHPATARQAVIAAMIFGPPKALGGE